MRPGPRVFTIAPERPFLDTLAAGLLARHFDPDHPEALAELTVLLPTRRAARALGEALLARAEAQAGVRALVLPAIRPLGDVDEDALAFDSVVLDAEGELDLPPEVPVLRRELLLAPLVRPFITARDHAHAVSAGEIARIARALSQLIDQASAHRVDLAKLESLSPEKFAAHWQETLKFLRILTREWPALLERLGAIDSGDRRDRLMERFRLQLESRTGGPPVIAAGSTGTHPATARLLATIARLPNGTVVLPGLDQGSPADAWDAVGPSHPQGAMKALLEVLQIARDEVEPWDFGNASGHPARTRFLREALRPWEATDVWHAALGPIAEEISTEDLGLTRLDAPGPAAEADAIALVLREALETPGRTAALVTPDRRLARGVSGALRRWGIEIDDSAGVPLALTPPAVFLRLVLRAVEQQLAPAALLALLKHPLCGLGLPPVQARVAARRFERACLRGLAPAPGLDGLKARIDSLRDEDRRRDASAFLARLEERLATILAAFARVEAQGFADLAALHVAAAEALAATDQVPGPERLWRGTAGESLSELFADLLAESAFLPTASALDYAGFLDVQLEGRVVRPPHGTHPRLNIWGPLEARLQRADVVVLGGLNEGTWPREPAPDPWLSRAMMSELGLPPPEQRLGLSAHDFVAMAAQAQHVVLSRSEKVDGAPTVPARWLVRMQVLAEGLGRPDLFAPRANYLGWAVGLDRPDGPIRAERAPEPRPPVVLRPRSLSVTQIATWIREPYSIYARKVLGLKKLRPIEEPAAANLRGDVYHEALHQFARRGIDPASPDAVAKLLALGEEVFAQHGVPDTVRVFWWPRFVSVAQAFVAEEAVRRAGGIVIAGAEIDGTLALAGPAGPFTLHARADRIDRGPGGALEIVDYKTGDAPTAAQMKAGLEPQLPLEAAIAAAGGFDSIPAAPVEKLRILRIRGTADPLEEREIGDVQALIADHLDRLGARIAQFDDPDMPYRAAVIPLFRRGRWTGDYDHLARLAEWSTGGEEDEA